MTVDNSSNQAVVSILRAQGIAVTSLGPNEVLLEVASGEKIRMQLRRRGYLPSSAQMLREQLALDAEPEKRVILWVVKQLSANARERARTFVRGGVLSLDRGEVILRGAPLAAVDDGDDEVLSGRNSRASAMRRKPWGRWALLRVLARTDEPRSQQQLAYEAGVSQVAVSKHLAALGEVVTRDAQGWRAVSRAVCWDLFLAEYPGSGGLVDRWISLAPVIEQAGRVRIFGTDPVLVSGDVAADAIASWRLPRNAVVYARRGINPDDLNFDPAFESESTLDFVVPQDPTIWPTANAWWGDGTSTADPLLVAWDLAASGGPNADEAIAHLRTQVLEKSQCVR